MENKTRSIDLYLTVHCVESTTNYLTSIKVKVSRTMSWIVDTPLTVFQRFFVNVIKCGPIPKHVAFIMDGNRRYATRNNVKRVEGHSRGFNKLAETLKWCRELGITEVTVYAFSIENFKRTKEEVEMLMKLAAEKFKKFLDEKDKIMTEGICIRVIGDISLLSEELKKLVAEAVLMTRDNSKAFLNVAFAYTSRDEMTNSIRTIVDGVKKGSLSVTDIDEELISKCLYTTGSPDPDILIRTSGEVRLSDFLLWQISGSNICFADVLWPDFCIWHLLYCVFLYQRSFNDLEKFKKFIRKERDLKEEKNGSRIQEFFQEIEQRRILQLKSYLNTS